MTLIKNTSTYQSRLWKLFLLQKKPIRIIYNLNYCDHTYVFFHSSKIRTFHDLVIYKTMIINGRVQTFFKPTAAINMYGTRQSKLFYVKTTNNTPRLLSLTVKCMKTWNSLTNEITQLLLTQFKNIQVVITYCIFINFN